MSRSFLLHSNTLTERGDGVWALEMYSTLAELGFSSFLAVPRVGLHSEARASELEAAGCSVVHYSSASDLKRLAKSRDVTHTMVFSSGSRSDPYYASEMGSYRIGKSIHITQSVFRAKDVHGDLFLPVSAWLYGQLLPRKIEADHFWLDGTLVSSLPHSITPPESDFSSGFSSLVTETLAFCASGDAGPIFLRFGGRTEFNDKEAQIGTLRLLERYPDSRFIAVNTEPFSGHERIVHLPALSRSEIWGLLRQADLSINGRRMGESFGLGIAESLSMGVPVIAPNWTRNPFMDKNHISLLGSKYYLYNSRFDFELKAVRLLEKSASADLKKKVAANTRSEVGRTLERLLCIFEERQNV